MESSTPTQPRRTSFQRLTARFTLRPKNTTLVPAEPEPEPCVPAAVTISIPEGPARAESLARLKQELMKLNEKECARMAEARADRIKVREAVERFRELAVEGCESMAGLGVVGELGE